MDRQKIERSIKGLSEWQMHVQAESDIDTNISTAIEALKAQLSLEGTTSNQPVATDTNIGDTISRQVAIDRFNVIRPVDPKKDEYTKGIDVGIAMCVVAVKDQPTIQPVATDTNVGNNSEIPNSWDCISRQAAIDALDCINGTEEVLRSLPPAQPEPPWIPVSERLPKDLSEVNVTWVNHNPELYYESIKDKPFTATAVYYKNEWYWYSATCVDYLGEYGSCDWDKIGEAIEIIAWMPLPEPYKGDEK